MKVNYFSKACAGICAVFLYIHAANAAPNDSLVLICSGPYPSHEYGLGKTQIDWEKKATRVFKINLITGAVSTVGWFGEIVGKLRFRESEESRFSLFFPINLQRNGDVIYEEAVSVNRFTGEVSGMYKVMGKDQIFSFSGECKVGEKKF